MDAAFNTINGFPDASFRVSLTVMLSVGASIEAVLFSAGEPLSKKRLATLVDMSEADLDEALKELHEALANRGLALIETADEVELRTSPDAASVVKKLRESELSRDLGKAGLETLALVLYRDGATRSEIDYIRGVNSTASLRSLLLRGLISRTEDATDKRRMRYQATPEALAHLGVSKAENLPRYTQLRAALDERGSEGVVFNESAE